jgi:hypothetical protein
VAGEEKIHARLEVNSPHARPLGEALQKPPTLLKEHGPTYRNWWVYGGSTALLWIIVLFNLANASFFLKAMPGPERFLPHRPMLITAVVALQIIVTAVLVGLFSYN